MTLAYDGSSYWSVSGGGWGGTREARYGPDGALQGSYAPGIDFRSVFTDTSRNVYARGYDGRTIFRQSAPGIFVSSITLQDGTLDPQAAVVMDGGEYLAMSGGTVYRWSSAGVFLTSVRLNGYGTAGSEGLYPQNRGIAVWDGYWLTYADQILSAWDRSGNRVDWTTLVGAGSSADAHYSYSFTNGMFFVEDGGTWRGYALGRSLNQAEETPEPGTVMLYGGGLLVLAWSLRRGRRKG